MGIECYYIFRYRVYPNLVESLADIKFSKDLCLA